MDKADYRTRENDHRRLRRLWETRETRETVEANGDKVDYRTRERLKTLDIFSMALANGQLAIKSKAVNLLFSIVSLDVTLCEHAQYIGVTQR